MRGKVIHFDTAQGFGFIAGDDGAQYAVAAENLRGRATPGPGDVVEFQPSGGRAYHVFAIGEATRADRSAEDSRPQPARFGRAGGAMPAMATMSPPASAQEAGLWDYFLGAMTTRYADFGGRARRKEYWSFALFFFVVLIALSLAGTAVDLSLGNLEAGDEFPVATVTLAGLFTLASIIPAIAVSVRRQHDIGLSGWFFLAVLLPFGSLVLLVFSLIPSQMRENRWGPVPAGVQVS